MAQAGLRVVCIDPEPFPRVRVGEFEAENVDAAVLDAVATDAEPLLGMSFLGNFKFEINTSAKTLKMLRVNAE